MCHRVTCGTSVTDFVLTTLFTGLCSQENKLLKAFLVALLVLNMNEYMPVELEWGEKPWTTMAAHFVYPTLNQMRGISLRSNSSLRT